VETLDILTVLLPTEVYQLIIFSGIIYFVLFFYGTNQWEKYTEFDKVVFSVIFGGFVWYFFILPISIFVFTLNVFQKPEIIIPNDFSKYSYFIYFILAFYLIYWRLFKINNRPLRDNNNFLKFTELLIGATISVIAVIDCVLLVAFSLSTYQEQLVYILLSILSLVLLIFLYKIFLKIFPLNKKFFQYSDNLPYLNLLKNKNLSALLIIIIMFVGAFFIGTYYLKTTSQFIDEKSTGLEIPRIETWKYRNNLSGIFDVEQYYTIKFLYIPWIKIKSNISLIDIYGKPYREYPNYTFRGEYEVIINGSRWSNVNVSLKGKKLDNNITRFYKIEKNNLNETVQRWDIIFSNPYDLYVKIYEIDIEKDNQFNQFINYNITNLRFNKEALDEILRNPQDQETVSIKDVGVRHNSLNLNQSITLFFSKNNT